MSKSARRWLAWALGAGSLVVSPWLSAAGGYVGLGAGISYAPDERFSETPVFIDYDLGFQVGALTFGWAFDNGWRAELEAAYRRNELEIIEFDGVRGSVNTGFDDAVDAASLMTNAIYEFTWGPVLRPYLGVGLGMARVGYEISVFEADEVILDASKTVFGYQAIAGVDVSLSRRLRVSADYRYWATADIDLRTEAGEPINTDHRVHQASVTLRYLFNGQPMPVRAREVASKNWYSELRLGPIGAEDRDIEDGLIDTNFDAFDLGTVLSFAVGYARQRGTGRGWRAEVEVSGWQNSADVIDFGHRRGEHRLHGSVKVAAVMGNLIYEFRQGAALRPFVGYGVGFAHVDYDITLQEDGTRTQYVDDTDSVFATQVVLGVSAHASERLTATLNYRYSWIPNIELEDPQQVTLKTEHSAHALLLGLRYRLGD